MAYVRLIEIATSPPTSYAPVSEQEVRQFLRLPELSPPDDLGSQIIGLISAATIVAEQYQGRDIVPRRYRLVVAPATGAYRLRAPVAAIHSVVEIGDDLSETPMPATEYLYDALDSRIVFLSAKTRAAVEFSTASTELTDAVRTGILQLISLWWQARTPVVEANSQTGPVELPHTLAALLRFGGDPYGSVA